MSELKATDDATFAVEYAAKSDLGMRRSNNQDALAAVVGDRQQWRGRGHLFMVADGMGAHAAGELASQMAVDNIPHTYQKLATLAPPAALRGAVQKANSLIFEKGQSSIEFNGMGTTCSCLALMPGAALVAHVGDSRVYRARAGRFEQLTFDHSLVWEMAAASRTSAEDVPACIPKNVITRSLGPHATVNVDLEGPYEVLPGDRFLLCSDGLTGVVEDALIGSLAACLTPQEAVDTLVDLANLRGGPDNISIVVAAVAGGDSAISSCNGAAATTSRANWEPGFWRRLFGWATSQPKNGANTDELGGPYGNGPHREYICNPATAASDMGFLCRELTSLESAPESPLTKHRSVDWKAFRSQCDDAQAAIDRGEHQAAISSYAAAIRHLMSEVRENKKSSDSNIL